MKKESLTNPIYTITSVAKEDADDMLKNPHTLKTRCVGFVYAESDVNRILKNNIGSLNEAGYWPYIVVEKISPGLYQYDKKPDWYEYSKCQNTWKKIQCPFKNKYQSVGYGMG